MDASGAGIYSVSFNPESGAFGSPKLQADCVNPSALCLSPDGRTLFAGREVFASDAPALLSFDVSQSGGLVERSRLPLAGELPCHLAFDAQHGRLASAQYWTGDVAHCAVRNGALQPEPSYFKRTGNGPNVTRQEGPHAHFVAFSNRGEVLHLVDLGTDSIVSHRMNDTDDADECATLTLPAGCGPRHMVLTTDESRAFVFCELDESLISLSRAGLGWKVLNVQPGFPAPEGEDGSGAAIRLSPDERFLYVSGRRQSSIACFALGVTAKPIGLVACGGLSPREFIVTADGRWVIVANQNSNTLTSLKRNQSTGQLTLSGHLCLINSPVALVEKTESQE